MDGIDNGSAAILAIFINLLGMCERAARVGEVANANQLKTKCIHNKQEFNGQLVEKKYNKNKG